MKLKYLGTCAAEGFPGMFCSCETCEKARRLGGRNIRTRSQALVDGELLIDFPADTYLHVLNYGLDLRKIKACIITHSHDDHCYAYDFQYRMHGYAYFPDESKKEPLEVYSSYATGAKLRSYFAAICMDESDKNAVHCNNVRAFESFFADGYKITPLKADHDIKTEPLIYIIEKDNKALLYAHDTGYFLPETWDYIEKSNIRFDFVSLDCTCILDDDAVRNHMGLKTCKEVKDRLLKIKNADEKTVFCVNHFSHNGRLVYDDLVPVAEKLGFKVSYDGAEFEF